MNLMCQKIHFFRKRCGLFDIVLTIIILVIFVPSSSEDDSICQTEVCNEAANLFLKNMNQSVDPCDDFYQYACGNFVRDSTIPYGLNRINYFEIITNEIDKKLNQTLSTNITEKDDLSLRLSKVFFQACMNSGNATKELKEVMRIVGDFGGWPSVHGSEWNETRSNWLQMTQKLQKLGYLSYSFFQVYFTRDKYIEIRPGSEEISFLNLLVLTVILEADKMLAYSDMGDLERFRDRLKAVRNESDQFQQEMTIRELQKKIPDINWLEYIEAAGPFNVDENQTIFVADLKYTLKLASILAQEPKRILANYVLSKVADNIMTFWNGKLLKTENPDQMLRRCMNDIKNYLGIAISSVYVKEYFGPKNQLIEEVNDILRHLKEQFADMFEKSTRLDDQLKKHALAKLDGLQYQIGYSEEILDNQTVEEYYNELELDKNSYFETLSRLRKFYNDKRQKIRDDRIWVKHPNIVQVNAINQNATTISISAGIMQGIFFDKDRPQYMNYGTLGSTIGHEIGHTFGPTVFRVTHEGYVPEFLNDPSSYSNYTESINCITNMYNNYSVKETNETINGELALIENFSDIVGLQAAYNAYKKWVEEHGEEQTLPRIERSSNELFWLSAATKMCTKYDSGSLHKIITKHGYALMETRIVNSFKNMPEFAEDYKCLPGSKMNPHQNERCPVF